MEVKKRNGWVLLGLAALIGWGIYDYSVSNDKDQSVPSVETTVKQEEQSTPPDQNGKIVTGIEEGNKAPDFQLQTVDGKEIKLSDLQGKKVIVNFWATWCPPCKAEMPHMQEFYLENSNDVEILAVNLTTSEKNANDVRSFVEDYGLSFPILLDSDGSIGRIYQAFTIPTSYVIDTKGFIQKRIVGPMDKEMMSELIANVK